MGDLGYILAMRQLMAVWSDQAQKEASQFADDHRDLLPRRITTSQLYGLAAVVRSVQDFTNIRRFIRHQGEKADRAGRPDVQGYWAALEQALGGLRTEARQLQQQAGPFPPEMDQNAHLNKLHRELAEAFVQHLIAHSLYWSPEPDRGSRKRSR